MRLLASPIAPVRPDSPPNTDHLTDDEVEALIDPKRVPRHVAIIMDGNGRWARQRGLSRIEGHRAAVDTVWQVVEECGRLHVEALTLYAFSTENWNRPRQEVRALMRLVRQQLFTQTPNLHRNNVRLQGIGETERLPLAVRWALRRATRRLGNNTGLVLNLALNYGGQQEILRAVKDIAREVAAGRLSPDDINEERFAQHLYTTGLPDPDLMLRTSGEMRLSNFLLWQSAYSEFHFTPVLWPDFRRRHLYEAILDFQGRERRYGGVGANTTSSS